MGATIGAILASAVGVAISPVPVIAVILMLFSGAATRNSVSFLLGWLAGLTGAGLIVLGIGFAESEDGPTTLGGVVKIAIGLLFLALGAKQWRSRPGAGQTAEMPAWMSSIDDFTAAKSFGIGVLLAGVNPKNLGLTIAAASTISAAGLEPGRELIVLAVFVVIASLTVAVPVFANLLAGRRVAPALDTMKDWLVANNSTVMAVLLVVLGAKVLGDGLQIVL